MEIAIGTRFFESRVPERVGLALEFVQRARLFAPHVLVAVNTQEDVSDACEVINNLKIEGIEAFAVEPWGKFVMPLNALILKAVERGATHLLLASAEVKVTREIVMALTSEMTDTTLVVGAAVIGHELGDGEIAGTGVTVPWNTLALWNLRHLMITGFPLIGDAPFDPSQAGVEELCTVSMLQRLNPNLLAVLLAVPGVAWDTANWDQARLAAHYKKMASKNFRPEAQRAYANFSSPWIIHKKLPGI